MVSSFRLYVTLVTSGSKRMTVKSLTKQELYDSGFSDEDIVLMQRMRTGGDNNRKGNNYEILFGIYLMLNYRSSNNVYLSNCLQGTVDDWVVISETHKFNFQLKNSEGTSGKFDTDLKKRFQLQEHYDKIHPDYLKKISTHTLVFSNPEHIQFNQHYIAENTLDNNESLYFPYRDTLVEMLAIEESHFKRLLHPVCPDQSQHETALRLIASVLGLEGSVSAFTEKLWEKVIRDAKPDIFNLSPIILPPQIGKKCEDLGIRLSCEYLVYNGLSVLVTEKLLASLNDAQLSTCRTPQIFISLLQRMMAETIKD